ncbi:S-layer homology domain-containing protein [candidate division KSB1 bacterium]|nr:S-layer homology domain-containing protein [candidate division KSB1 bacterium]
MISGIWRQFDRFKFGLGLLTGVGIWLNCSTAPPLRSDLTTSFYEQGLQYLQNEAWAEAEKSFQHALKMTPNQPDIYLKLGVIYLHWQQYPTAEENFSRALKIDPNSVDAIVGQAQVALARKELSTALHRLQEALELDAHHVAAHYQLGLVYKASQNLPYAIEAWEKVLAWQPSHIGAQLELKAVYAQSTQFTGNQAYEKWLAAPQITRGELAWILVREFQVPMPTAVNQVEIKDIKGHFAKSEISRLVAWQIMAVNETHFFQPEVPLTRGELARIAENLYAWATKDRSLSQSFAGMNSPYQDLGDSASDFSAVMLVTTLGILEGYADGTFKPEAVATGQEVFQFIEKLKNVLP